MKDLKGQVVQIEGAYYMKQARKDEKLSRDVEESFHNLVQDACGACEEEYIDDEQKRLEEILNKASESQLHKGLPPLEN